MVAADPVREATQKALWICTFLNLVYPLELSPGCCCVFIVVVVFTEKNVNLILPVGLDRKDGCKNLF